jgi:uncharacterized phiE125 gp8 family phage protein
MALPLNLNDAKALLRVDGDDYDAIITPLISAAFSAIERECGLVAEAREQEFLFDGFSRVLTIPLRPVGIGTVTVAYLDRDGTEQVASDIRAYLQHEYVRVCAAPGRSWPFAFCGTGTVKITATVGYADAALYPAAALIAAQMLIAAWFKDSEGPKDGLPEAACELLETFRLRRV